MSNRDTAASGKRLLKEAKTSAIKRTKSTDVVSIDVETKRPTSGTANVPKKVYNTRLRRRLEEEQAKVIQAPIVCTTQLTDVNVDCLESIFKHLSLVDILNIAGLNKHIKTATDAIFQKRLGKKWVKIEADGVRFYEKDEYDPNGPTDEIPRSFCFKLLRLYGESIPKLNITYPARNYKVYAKSDAHIMHYIIKYCANSLLELTLVDCSTRALANQKSPFAKVEAVSFVNCRLGTRLSKLDEWFPTMRCLRFTGANEITNGNTIAVRLPNLKELNVQLPNGDEFLKHEHFAELIRLNPKIRTLCISGNVDAKYLHSISNYLQHVEQLHIQPGVARFSNIEDSNVHFPNVKKLTFNSHMQEESDILSRLTFKKPEEFIFKSISGGINLDHRTAACINMYPTLTKLTYRGWKHGEEGALLMIASPAWIEVDLGLCDFPLREVIAFMRQCVALQKITVGLKPSDCQAVLDRFAGDWRKTCEVDGYYLTNIVTMERGA